MANEYKHINLAYLVKMSQKQKSIQEKMLNTFLISIPGYIEEVKVAYTSENWYDLGYAAYKAKEVVPIIGLTQLARDLHKLDMLCRKAEDIKNIVKYVDHFLEVGPEVVNEVEKALAELKSK